MQEQLHTGGVKKFKYLVIIINEILAMQNTYEILSGGMFASCSSKQQSQKSNFVTLLISFPHASFMHLCILVLFPYFLVLPEPIPC